MIRKEFALKYDIPTRVVNEAAMLLPNPIDFYEWEMKKAVAEILKRRIETHRNNETLLKENKRMLDRILSKKE